jgi:cyclopropane fatty-acyl-phospholipid synthase-like methyltransferase
VAVVTAGPAASPVRSPDRIMRLAQSFMESRVLLSAVELGLFGHLGGGEDGVAGICASTGLHPRCAPDFLDALACLGLLERSGAGPAARYRNAPEAALFLDPDGRLPATGLLEMMGERLFRQWADLTQCLRSGTPQAEAGEGSLFAALYERPGSAGRFADAMSAASRAGVYALMRKVDLSACRSLLDVGGSTGQLAVLLARRYPQLRAACLDLPALAEAAGEVIESSGLAGRVTFLPADFFTDPLPPADVIVMSLVLHNWGDAQKAHLISAASAALPPGGLLIAMDNLLDDERQERLPALLGSVNMLLQTEAGRGYSAAEFRQWTASAGFGEVRCEHLSHSLYALVARKEGAG